MRFTWISILFLAGCAQFSSPCAPSYDPRDPFQNGARVFVERVIDGDTVVVRTIEHDPVEVRVRLLGIDCPETRRNAKCQADEERGLDGCDVQIPLGRHATEVARQLLHHRTVVLENDEAASRLERDVYQRVLAYIRMPDGRDFGEVMISQTACEDYGWRYPHPRMKRYLSVQGD